MRQNIHYTLLFSHSAKHQQRALFLATPPSGQ